MKTRNRNSAQVISEYMQLDCDAAEKLGKKIAEALCLELIGDGYYDTEQGRKTDIGLGRMIAQVIADQLNNAESLAALLTPNEAADVVLMKWLDGAPGTVTHADFQDEWRAETSRYELFTGFIAKTKVDLAFAIVRAEKESQCK